MNGGFEGGEGRGRRRKLGRRGTEREGGGGEVGQHGANAGNSSASRKFIASQIQNVLKVRPDLRAVDIKNDMLSNFGIKINYSKAWYESMVHATNPGSRVVIDADDGRFRRLFISYNACIEGFIAGCRSLLFLDGTFIKDRYRGILLSATGENPYQSPHRLVMISDADKGIRAAVEEFFPDAFHSRIDSDRSQGLRHCNGILPGEMANAHFPGIRYGHVTSNVVESFNSWIRKARLLRILPLVETIRKQIMERMHERRLVGQKWSGYLCSEAEMVLCDNIQHGFVITQIVGRDGEQQANNEAGPIDMSVDQPQSQRTQPPHADPELIEVTWDGRQMMVQKELW
ncbi:uncharacterized protein LOC109847243 [Asparagus officinalis]|uniref:uncharacterized protein LOC109847243 n=1 Tax=Asparagus officinalis TaxID=4686 RepID=UPI00098DFA1D|nr:uncharacterized protein LOC109847243 [Asparagus officinalis]